MTLHKHVVVIGGGFAGLAVARALRNEPVHITLVDRRNHHLFQPLLYQVAMAGLSPAEIAVPIRSVLRKQQNARILLAEVSEIDFRNRRVLLKETSPLDYDYLVIAVGSRTTYFGNDGWEGFAPGLKDVEDAIEIRRRVLSAFEAAEREENAEARRQWLTFVVIGGGPTGVELAGAIAELAGFVLSRDFRSIHPQSTRVVLVEGSERVLGTFAPDVSEQARKSLVEMGVDVRTKTRVTGIDERGVALGDGRIDARTVLWAAGVAAAPLTRTLGVDLDRQGRVRVEQDCSLPGHRDVFCIGDAARFVPNGSEQPLPGVSPVAMQQGRFVARQIARSLRGAERETFAYRDKGSLATIGRSRAVAEVGKLRLSGFIAWLFWLLIHIYYLIDFRNRILVLIDWAWAYFSYERGARLITGRSHAVELPAARAARNELKASSQTEGEPRPVLNAPESPRDELHAKQRADGEAQPAKTTQTELSSARS